MFPPPLSLRCFEAWRGPGSPLRLSSPQWWQAGVWHVTLCSRHLFSSSNPHDDPAPATEVTRVTHPQTRVQESSELGTRRKRSVVWSWCETDLSRDTDSVAVVLSQFASSSCRLVLVWTWILFTLMWLSAAWIHHCVFGHLLETRGSEPDGWPCIHSASHCYI